MSESSVRVRRPVLWSVTIMLFLSAIACDDIRSLVGSQKPPAVSITQPLNGAQVDIGQQLDIVAMVTHSKGITHIEFWVDGILDGSQLNPLPNTSSSFSARHTWSAHTPGQHILLARAYDSKGCPSPTLLSSSPSGKGNRPQLSLPRACGFFPQLLYLQTKLPRHPV